MHQIIIKWLSKFLITSWLHMVFQCFSIFSMNFPWISHEFPRNVFQQPPGVLMTTAATSFAEKILESAMAGDSGDSGAAAMETKRAMCCGKLHKSPYFFFWWGAGGSWKLWWIMICKLDIIIYDMYCIVLSCIVLFCIILYYYISGLVILYKYILCISIPVLMVFECFWW